MPSMGAAASTSTTTSGIPKSKAVAPPVASFSVKSTNDYSAGAKKKEEKKRPDIFDV